MSCFSKLFAAGQPQTYDLAELGRYYRGYQALMEHWHAAFCRRGEFSRCDYEDVVADLEGQARRIVAHCGLAWEHAAWPFTRPSARCIRRARPRCVSRIYRTAIGRAQFYEPFLEPLRAALSGHTPQDQYGSLASRIS